ncbi:MAG: AAA family ATPase [Candidatus Buchananbacteria bacterium]|nr:AAA family ATPase [Candidatus Buchananbacteria bacterium]
MSKVLILTGPCGAGKTTISELLEKEHGFIRINGDILDTEFFPQGGQWLEKNHVALIKSHDKILAKTKEAFDSGSNVVVDYIIFDKHLDFFEKFKKEFGNNLAIKVLFPDQKHLNQRDINHQCWTSGPEHISQSYGHFESLKMYLGEKNYIDTSEMTEDEVIKHLLQI